MVGKQIALAVTDIHRICLVYVLCAGAKGRGDYHNIYNKYVVK